MRTQPISSPSSAAPHLPVPPQPAVERDRPLPSTSRASAQVCLQSAEKPATGLDVEDIPAAKLLETAVATRGEDSARTRSINQRIERILQGADLTTQVPFVSRMNNSLYKIEGAEIPILLKKVQSPRAAFLEELAYRASEELGFHLVPPTIARGKSVLQPFLDKFTEEKRIAANLRSSRGISFPAIAKVFSYLVNQQDDNLGNRMWDAGANLMLIDHESTFFPKPSRTHEAAIGAVKMDDVFTDETWKRFFSTPAAKWRALCETENLSLCEDAIAGFLDRIAHVRRLTEEQIAAGSVRLADPRGVAARVERILGKFELRLPPRTGISALSGTPLQTLESAHRKLRADQARMADALQAERSAALEPLLEAIESLKTEIPALKADKARLKSELTLANRTGLWNWVRVRIENEPELPAERDYRQVKSSVKSRERRLAELKDQVSAVVRDYSEREAAGSRKLTREAAEQLRHTLLEQGVYVDDKVKEALALEQFLSSKEAQTIIDRAICSRFGVPDRQKSTRKAVLELQAALAQQPYFSSKHAALQKTLGRAHLCDEDLLAHVSSGLAAHAERQVETLLSNIRREGLFTEIARRNAEFEARRAQLAEENEDLRRARWRADQEAFARQGTGNETDATWRRTAVSGSVAATASRAVSGPGLTPEASPPVQERPTRRASISSSMIDREIAHLRDHLALHGEGSITTEASDLAREWAAGGVQE